MTERKFHPSDSPTEKSRGGQVRRSWSPKHRSGQCLLKKSPHCRSAVAPQHVEKQLVFLQAARTLTITSKYQVDKCFKRFFSFSFAEEKRSVLFITAHSTNKSSYLPFICTSVCQKSQMILSRRSYLPVRMYQGDIHGTGFCKS